MSRQIKVVVMNPANDDAIYSGYIVWGLHGCIGTLHEYVHWLRFLILKTQFQNNTSTKFVVWWYGDDTNGWETSNKVKSYAKQRSFG